MFVVHISDGGQQDKEVTVHAEVAPRVWLVEEMEENKGDRLAQRGRGQHHVRPTNMFTLRGRILLIG